MPSENGSFGIPSIASDGIHVTDVTDDSIRTAASFVRPPPTLYRAGAPAYRSEGEVIRIDQPVPDRPRERREVPERRRPQEVVLGFRLVGEEDLVLPQREAQL